MANKSINKLAINDTIKSDAHHNMTYLVIGIEKGLICLKYIGNEPDTVPFIITDMNRLKDNKFYIVRN